jgi:YggT family protein
VNVLLCELSQILNYLITVYIVVMFVYAIVSWIPSIGGRWVYYLAAIVEPVLIPVRRIIPPMGGFDLAFLVVLLVLQLVLRPMVSSAIFNTCYRIF